MDSLQKLEQALEGAGSIEPADEQTARMLQVLQMTKPMLASMIPDTPQALDAQLLGLVEWLLGIVSDNPRGLGSIELVLNEIGGLRREVGEGIGYDVDGALGVTA